MGIFDKRESAVAEGKRSALEQAASRDDGGFTRAVTELVEKLLDVGIDGRGPFSSSHEVAAKARAGARSEEGAVTAVIRQHVRHGAVGGFVTGLGGFVTLPVALPANVAHFYLVATRMVAAIAELRGYDVAEPHIRSAVLLTLVGADAEDLLKKAGAVTGMAVTPGGRLTNLAAQRLPGPALMVLNKAIGFRLLARTGRSALGRFGKAVPVVGGLAGAGFDAYLLGRIAAQAKSEFPHRAA
ncbi:MAG: EcsC family protein [Actinomycetales bacterium]|nr:EcsC family protein [Actinomycetales bacterium]